MIPSQPPDPAVIEQLESLCAPGAALATDGPNATWRLTEGERARRLPFFISEYIRRCPVVNLDGVAAVVTAGPPGAGKSHAIAHQLDLPDSCRDIDADIAKEVILEHELTSGRWTGLLATTLADGRSIRPLELASLVHEESLRVAENVFERSLSLGENVVVHGTLSWREQPDRLLHQLLDAAYEDLTIVDVEVTSATAVQQAIDRWWARRIDPQAPLGGRFLPRRFIEGLYDYGPSSRCATHADLMFAHSALPHTRLLRLASADSGLVDVDTRKTSSV